MSQTALQYTDEEILARLPHTEARPGQIEAIRFILKSFAAGKRFVFLEAPTGAGKSAIGLTVAEFFDRSFYLTIQKILQNQISRDYAGAQMTELKGRNAYPCTYYATFGERLVQLGRMKQDALDKHLSRDYACDDGYCARNLGKRKCKGCFPPKPEENLDEYRRFLNHYGVEYSTCPYYEQVGKAQASRKVLMNFSSFLHQTTYTDRFGPRDVLIIDEGHHCEEQLLDFISFSVSDRDLGIELPRFEETMEYTVWIAESGLLERINGLIEEAKNNNNLNRQEDLERLQHRIQQFLEAVEAGDTEWVHDYVHHHFDNAPSYNTITVKPIYVHRYAQEMFFRYGTNILIMSATILDAGVMARSLGIEPSEVAFYRLPNSFPVKNRPIFLLPACQATGGKKQQHVWGPAMVKWTDRIVEMHKGKRGIIHTHNFAIARMLMEQCTVKERFLFQEAFKTKDDMLAAHSDRPDGVIVAPAMHEGIDLKDDLSRFQIICKTPWPNIFEDKQLMARADADRRYLIWLVALRLVQAYGRSIRSATDWANTYVLDTAINNFISEANRMLPKWFTEAIQRVKK